MHAVFIRLKPLFQKTHCIRFTEISRVIFSR